MNYSGNIDLPVHVNSTTKDFIHSCLELRPERRKNARQLLDHPFIKMSDDEKYASFTTQVTKMHILNSGIKKSDRAP